MTIPWPTPDEGSADRPAGTLRPADIDRALADLIVDRLVRDERTHEQDITVDVQNRVAVLTGWVDSAEAARSAGELAWQTPGVVDVCDSLIWLDANKGQEDQMGAITKRQTGSTVRLELRGEIDLATAGEVRDAVIAALARYDPSTVVLDLQQVSFIDSIGIGELVKCQRAATACGATLTLENLALFPRRQLWATGLLGLFGFTGAEPHAD
ncbi:anti-sigma factor antagonist [Actinomycetes bacterium KLBMP 9797]